MLHGSSITLSKLNIDGYLWSEIRINYSLSELKF